MAGFRPPIRPIGIGMGMPQPGGAPAPFFGAPRMGFPPPMMRPIRPMRPRGRAGQPRTPSPEPGPDATTVFVGNLTEQVSDTVIRDLLSILGSVVKWKRVQGPTGRLQGFGFCTFDTPEGAVRALHLLAGIVIYGKDVRVTADAKAQAQIAEYFQGLAASDAESSAEERLREAMKPVLAGVGAALTSPGELDDARRQLRTACADAKLNEELKALRGAAEGPPGAESSAAPSSSSAPPERRASPPPRPVDRRSGDGSGGGGRASPGRYDDRQRRPSSGRDAAPRHREGPRRSNAERTPEELYMDRERAWLHREAQQRQKRQRDADDEVTKKAELQLTIDKQREMEAAYDDDRDDDEFYRSSLLAQLQRERHQEEEWEASDRARELEELERLEKDKVKIEGFGRATNGTAAAASGEATTTSATDSPAVRDSHLAQIFNPDEEEQLRQQVKKKRKLITIEYTEEEMRAAGLNPDEERKRKQKAIVATIPAEKDALFAYNVAWDQLTREVLDKSVRPWVNKKIATFIGEEEPTLVSFICDRVFKRATPQSILDEISAVLDDEAEMFVVKLWRMVIYSTQAVKRGLQV